MTYWVGKLAAFFVLVAFLAAVAPGCDSSTTGGDSSETHFLSDCDEGDDCGGGLECICGVCTRRCTENAGCGDLADAATCEDSCGSATAASKICDVACAGDVECDSLGAGFSCRSGKCRSGEDTVGSGGAGGQGSVVPQGGAGPVASNCQADPDPTPEVVPNAELDADVIARAAAVIGSCMADDGVDRNATHMWHANIAARRTYFLSVTQADCLANANCGCAAVEHCLGYQVQSGVDPNCTPSCEGDVYTVCGEAVDIELGFSISIDCGKVGQSCDPATDCADPATVRCEGSEPSICRDGARPLFCDDGAMREGPDCAALGLGCLDGICQGTGATCTNGVGFSEEQVVGYEPVSCSDGTLETCVHGRLASVDCATQGPGFACQSVDGIPFCGLASDCFPADEGSGSPTPESCDGTNLTFCNAGRLDTIDCLSLGFTGCAVDRSMGLYGCTPTLELEP